MFFPDEERTKFTIDEVLALYLIDVADRCKKSPPILAAGSAELVELGVQSSPTKQGSTSKGAAKAQAAANQADAVANLERNNYHFYMTIAVFVQQYRSCLNDTIYATFEGRTATSANSNA